MRTLSKAQPNRKVVALAYDNLCSFEFGIATELFGIARPELNVPWYEFRVVAISKEPIRATGGVLLQASANLRHVREAGTIIIPGWSGIDKQPPEQLLEALRQAHRRGARIVSICSGVYVLAASGLLDGLPATTHWKFSAHLKEKYPLIDVRPNVLYVDNGQLLTSAGSAAGIDLGLHIIRCDYGSAVAGEVARRLVVPPQREGGQAQFIRNDAPSAPVERSDKRIGSAMAWAEANLEKPISIPALAARSHMSPRHFARRFTQAQGTTPLSWLLIQRLRLARTLLETTSLPLESVAESAGFGTIESMRHHFRRELNTSPSRYRCAFTEREG